MNEKGKSRTGEGEIAHARIEQVLGKAMLDEGFQETLFTDPEKVGRELGLNESGIALVKKIDRKAFKEFKKRLDAKLLRDAAAIIFCASY